MHSHLYHPSVHSLGFTACVTSLYALRNAPSAQSTSGWAYGLDREHTNPQMSAEAIICSLFRAHFMCVCVYTLLPPQSPSGQELWYMKGALEVVLRHSSALPGGATLTDTQRDHFESVASEMGRKGLRGTDHPPVTTSHTSLASHIHTLTFFTHSHTHILHTLIHSQ